MKTKIYSIGPDKYPHETIPLKDRKDASWIVYWYEEDGYEGSGQAVTLRKSDGKLWVIGLGHNSTCGPFDDGLYTGDVFTVQEYLHHSESVDWPEIMPEVDFRVCELLARDGLLPRSSQEVHDGLD